MFISTPTTTKRKIMENIRKRKKVRSSLNNLLNYFFPVSMNYT
jgi:hypothetical protein